ncbi:hypothetical protein MUN88_06240 [Gracilibacillus caseinilyticus]|uniref:Spore coat protein W n=1 Tax=Gracilibacillus caseinilyticus TaxID=2932256 RepID=A0ABY4F0G8_9BACI|nr:hypothetical protein [Gracilibacillus caseinilyticus]UOQ49677.1 hypothetical protein MUN88_06240 [Gracilibacillus caseinilyticus]
MESMNKELNQLSKSIAGFTVRNVFQKHNITNDESVINKLSDEQRDELKNIAKNLDSLVNDFVSNNKQESVKKGAESVESPIRELMKKINKKESGR